MATKNLQASYAGGNTLITVNVCNHTHPTPAYIEAVQAIDEALSLIEAEQLDCREAKWMDAEHAASIALALQAIVKQYCLHRIKAGPQ